MLAILLSLLLAATDSPQTSPREAELQCHVGPAIESIGGNDWHVYACQDGKSVVVAAGTPNPATPFFFIVRPDGEGVTLYGEGTGDKAATKPAYDELQNLSAAGLANLHMNAVKAHRE